MWYSNSSSDRGGSSSIGILVIRKGSSVGDGIGGGVEVAVVTA